MYRPRIPGLAAALLVAALLAGGCGGDDGGGDVDNAAPAADEPTATESEETADGEVVFEEDFDDDSADWGPELQDDEFQTGEISDGVMRFSGTESYFETLEAGQQSALAFTYPGAIEDQVLAAARVEATVTFTRGGVAGLACGIDPTGESPANYYFSASSAGSFLIQKYNRNNTMDGLVRLPHFDADTPAEEVLAAEPAFEHQDNSVHEIAAECRANGDTTELTMFFDGEEVLSFEDSDDPIPSGIVAVAYGESALQTEVNGFTPFDVTFDDFVLTDLDG